MNSIIYDECTASAELTILRAAAKVAVVLLKEKAKEIAGKIKLGGGI